MVDRLGTKERELKLGTSFTNPKECAFHTLRYDFKPASVDKNKMATIDVGRNSEITVTFPPNLIFKGSSKSYQKQGIAIVDLETGDVTLEKLTCNISVKQIRSENKAMSAQKLSMIDQYISGQKPKKGLMNKVNKVNNSSSSFNSMDNSKSKQSNKNKDKPPTQTHQKNLLPIHSIPAKNSPNSSRFQSGSSPCNASPSKATVDDQAALDDWLNSVDSSRSNSVKHDFKKLPSKEVEVKLPVRPDDEVGELSDSSSSGGSSSSGDSSSESSDSESQPTKKKMCQNGHIKDSPDPEALLKEDLHLSESGSDSD